MKYFYAITAIAFFVAMIYFFFVGDSRVTWAALFSLSGTALYEIEKIKERLK